MPMNPQKEQRAYNILVLGEYPTEIISVHNLKCEFTFSPQDIPGDIPKLHEYMTKVVRVLTIDGVYVNTLHYLPSPLFFAIVNRYIIFQREELRTILSLQEEFAQTSLSRRLWEVMKATSPAHIFEHDRLPLDFAQRYWVLQNVRKDEQDKGTLIKQVFETLQPWLNLDLYKQVKESEEKKRSNYRFDDDAFDMQMQAKANAMLKPRPPTDLDEITIEDN